MLNERVMVKHSGKSRFYINGDMYEIVCEDETHQQTFVTERHYSVKRNGKAFGYQSGSVDLETIVDSHNSKTPTHAEQQIVMTIETDIRGSGHGVERIVLQYIETTQPSGSVVSAENQVSVIGCWRHKFRQVESSNGSCVEAVFGSGTQLLDAGLNDVQWIKVRTLTPNSGNPNIATEWQYAERCF